MSTEEGTPTRIIDTTFYSIGFPNESWDELLNRDNYLNLIEEKLSQETKVLFIEGDEDAGKTTLCAQFAKKHLANTISVFFNPYNELDYKVDFLFSNAVFQIKHLVKEIFNIDELDSYASMEEYNQCIFQLRKMLRKDGGYINMIIDGLEAKINNGPDFIKSLFDVLPVGQDIFRFVVSGNQQDFLRICPKLKRQEVRSITLSGFSPPEIANYLEIELSSRAELSDLFQITHGLPGRLKTLKRLISSQKYSLNDINESTNYKNWIELDCDQVDLDQPNINGLISIIAHTEVSFQIEDLAKLCSQEINEIKQIINSISILSVAGNKVNFVSKAHKKYFANLLRGNRKSIEELLIQYYANEDTLNAKFELAKLYAQKQSWGNLIDLFDENYIGNILESTGAIEKASQSLELGVRASLESHRYVELFRYSIQGSILNELDNYLFWESEIEARISVKDFVGAISLAESAVLRIDRLRLLALIARRQKELKNNVDEDLINLITDLYKVTDLSNVGEKIYDIVSDLIYVIPNLAIEMIESSSRGVSDTGINDWVVAKLSIAAIDASLKDEENTDRIKKLEAVQSINHPSVRKIYRAISFLVLNYSASKVLVEVAKLTDSKEKLKLLRLWLRNNRSNVKDIENVIELALDELVKASSKSTITIDTLKELSNQLPYIKDPRAKEKLMRRFISIEKGISDLGLSRNKYIYKLNIFHTKFTLDKEKSIGIINYIINEIDGIEDKLIKLESFAEVYSKLTIIRPPELIPTYKFVYSRILSLTEELFKISAHHLKTSQYILETIGNKNPTLALKICENINTRYRRENARLLILDSYLANNLKRVKIEVLKLLEDSFEISHSRQEAYIRILERYSEAKSLHFDTIKALQHFIGRLEIVVNPSSRLYGYVLSYSIICKNKHWKERMSHLFKANITKTWNLIEADWERIDKGFQIVSHTAQIDESFAHQILQKTEDLKRESWIDSPLVAYTYLNSLKICIKAFVGLIISNNNSDKDFEILESLIQRIPSETEKLLMWTEVGLWTDLLCKDTLKHKIYNDHALPLMQGILQRGLNINRVLPTFILIHVFNSELADEYLGKLPRDNKEEAYNIICDYYITKRSPFEIYNKSEINKYSASFNDLAKAVSALSRLTVDNHIYMQIDQISKALTNSRITFSKLQISDIAAKLSDIVESKLPDINNIEHDGFKILAQIKLALLKKENTNWADFIDRAKLIPNDSDRLFVKSHFIEDIPFQKIANGNDVKKQLINEISHELGNLKIHFEFVQRVIDVSETMYKNNQENWKDIVKEAFSVTTKLEEGSQIYESQKRIIDSMYRLDPSFAKKLIQSIDPESTVDHIAELIQEHYETLDIAAKIKNNKDLDQKEADNYRNIVNGVYKALGALNSEKVTTKKISEASKYLTLGNKLPLHEVFPVYMYYLTNCAKTYREKELEGPVANIHKENFKEAVNSTNLIQILSHRRKFNEKSFRNFFVDEDFTANKAIKPRSKEEAMSFIRDWMRDELDEFIYIVDPYFRKEDLEYLQIIQEINREIEVEILGSVDGPKTNIEEDYKTYWRKISDELPPYTNITFCWNSEDNNSSPFHDRWFITGNGGLRLGTSLNSLGAKKDSELSIMKSSDALNIKESVIKDYLNRKKREINHQRLSYKSFSL